MKFSLIIFLLLQCFYSAKCDDLVTKNIDIFNLKYPTEDVYIHFDNNSYFLGDTIWFKAYVRNRNTGLRSDISKVLYVELLCDLGYVRETKKMKINHGVCNGFFSLTDSLYRGGFYEIRAKTRSMLSFGNEPQLIIHRSYSPYFFKFDLKNETFTENLKNSNFGGKNNRWEYWGFQHPGLNISSNINNYEFSKVIPVYDEVSEGAYHYKNMNKGAIIGEGLRSKIKEIYIDFFPEGGNIIKGVETKVGFEIKDKSGSPIAAKGYIKNSKGETISQINTIKDGMGCFYLNPVSGDENDNSYTAYINYENKEYKFDLPKAKDYGISMITDISGTESINIRIQEHQLNRQSNREISLIVISPSNNWQKYPLALNSDSAEVITINRSEFDNGVNRLVICDSKGNSYCDRLLFIDNRKATAYNMTISGLKKNYKPYEKIELEISLSDNNGMPIIADLSVAVRDKKYLEKSYDSDNIESHFMIRNNLDRFIPNISKYMNMNNNKLYSELDLYLINTQKRRYEWDELMLRKNPVIDYKVEKGLSIGGYVFDATRNNKNNNARALEDMFVESVISFDTLEIYGDTRSDKNGYFNFLVPDYYGRVYAKIDINEKKSGSKTSSLVIRDYHKKYYLPIDRIISTFPKEYNYYERNIIDRSINDNDNESELDSLFDFSVNLDNVTVKAKQKSKRVKRGYPIFRSDIREEINNSLDKGDILCGNISKLYLINDNANESYIYSDELIWCNNPVNGSKLEKDIFFVNDRNEAVGLYEKSTSKEDSKLIPITSVENVEIYSSYGPRSLYDKEFLWSKAISDVRIYFYKTNGYKRTSGNSLRILEYNGYSYGAKFNHKDYSSGINENQKDYRRTLYWNPTVITDENGKAKIEFYNNTTCQDLNISIETLTFEGVPVVYNK